MRFVLLVIALVLFGCQQQAVAPDKPQEHRSEEEESKAEVVARARFAVEGARLLAIPVDSLGGEIRKGFALPLYGDLPTFRYEDSIDRIVRAGATDVSVVYGWSQATIYHNRIAPLSMRAVDEDRLQEVISYARDKGLRVLLFPLIHVEQRREGEWRGRLAPTDLPAWKLSYEAFIRDAARIASSSKVDILSVGSELSSMEGETQWWLSMIKGVREIFDGELIYSSNWDSFVRPQFWEALDYVGVSAYFEVARSRQEGVDVLAGRWQAPFSEARQVARRAGRPLILTEVGYPAVDSAAMRPWDYTARTGPNPLEQLAAFRSLTMGWQLHEAHPDGLYIWHAWGPGGPTDVGYSVWDKPAQSLVQQWFHSGSEEPIDLIRDAYP